MYAFLSPTKSAAVQSESTPTLGGVARCFLWLGMTGFGGAVALISAMEHEFCRKRSWIDAQKFSLMYSLCKLFPGPIAVQMAIWLGREFLGTPGALVAGFSFIAPSFLMIVGLSWAYFRAPLPEGIAAALIGMQIGALAVIAVAATDFFRPYRRRMQSWLIAAAAGVAVYVKPAAEPLLILFAGMLGVWASSRKDKMDRSVPGGSWLFFAPSLSPAFQGVLVHPVATGTLIKLFVLCFKAGAFAFGTVLVILPLLEGEAVTQNHWLTHREFLDGLAIGQITPGPISITVAFIGYKVAGIVGALIASAGIYLPSFLNILFIVPKIIRRLEKSRHLGAFTKVAMPAIVGCIFASLLKMGSQSIHTWPALAFGLILVVITLYQRPPAWVSIPGAGLWFALLGRYLGLV